MFPIRNETSLLQLQRLSHDKIVYIDIDTLLNKYNLYLDKKSELEGQSKTAEKALAGKIEAFSAGIG